MRGGRTGRRGNRRCMSFREEKKTENRKSKSENRKSKIEKRKAKSEKRKAKSEKRKAKSEKRRSRFNAEDAESAEYAEKNGLEAGMRWTVGELAKAIEARLEGEGAVEITGVAAPGRAGAKGVIYVGGW